jgi:hypothetical protein
LVAFMKREHKSRKTSLISIINFYHSCLLISQENFPS